MEHGGNRGESVVRVKIFVEGGGRGDKNNSLFRAAWMNLFTSAGLAGRLPTVVRCGDRAGAFRRFSDAVRKAGDDDLPILLVDSEGPVEEGKSVWGHLQDRDGWRRPAGVDDNQAYLMVQAMEAWLLADRDALREYFGQGFNENRLPGQNDPEQIPVAGLESSLRSASANCRQQYAKGVVSFQILGLVNADRLAERCRHAKALFDYLQSL